MRENHSCAQEMRSQGGRRVPELPGHLSLRRVRTSHPGAAERGSELVGLVVTY